MKHKQPLARILLIILILSLAAFACVDGGGGGGSGYEGDGYEPLEKESWTVHAWEAQGGYGNQRKGKKGKADNAKRERIWFSPACNRPVVSRGLFDDVGDDVEEPAA